MQFDISVFVKQQHFFNLTFLLSIISNDIKVKWTTKLSPKQQIEYLVFHKYIRESIEERDLILSTAEEQTACPPKFAFKMEDYSK